MHTINVEFRRLDYTTVDQVLDRIGIYCIWAGKAQYRPTYIGEGWVAGRLTNHVEVGRFESPIRGYIAILEDVGAVITKKNAEITEALLLAVAEDVDRSPSQNSHPGKRSKVYNVFRSHDTLRINVRGYDPLQHPSNSREMAERRVISVYSNWTGDTEIAPFEDDFGEFWWRHDWRMRRRVSRKSSSWF